MNSSLFLAFLSFLSGFNEAEAKNYCYFSLERHVFREGGQMYLYKEFQLTGGVLFNKSASCL